MGKLYWLYIATFLDLLATSLLVPFLPLHLASYGLPRLVVGVITSVYPSVQLFSSPAIGFYSQKYGQKCTLITSLLLCSLAYYSIATTSSVLVIFICRVILGLAKHTQTICKAAFLLHNDILNKNVGFGGFSAAEALGFMLGPVIGGHFIGREDGFRYLCKMTATLFVFNSFIVYLVLPKENRVVHDSSKTSENVVKVYQVKDCENFLTFWDTLLLKLILCFSLSLFYTNYHVMVVEYLMMPHSMVGYTNSFQGLICIITGLFASKISDLYLCREYYFKLSICFLLLSSSFFLIDFVSECVTFVISLIPLSCSSSLLRIYLTEALLSHPNLNNRASIIGLENSIATIASLASPFVFEFFSYLSATLSITYLAFLISGFGSMLSLILFLTKGKEIYPTKVVTGIKTD
ncbi:major facilitator superfamily domain-containing protein 9-like [Macrosteles quadrilineatus]|uniref:major facilitator superfamily domain-containing protein 9-like n=1 Tax=Macrosteles quadrilineatus TaxID=74068 RepID=UPI0023E2BDCC|nr:major facilitator superfamily domain-containing protein 9-like [Macrosteles quadrilineatus]